MTPQPKKNASSSSKSLAMLIDEPLQKEPIRIYLRLRPFNKFERTRRSINCVSADTPHVDIVKEGMDNNIGGEKIKINSPLDGEFNFVFDKIFREDSTQISLYKHIVTPFATHALEGYNCALIAYGQTGSGKTHTMMGCGQTKSKRQLGIEKELGLIHLLIKDLFHQIKISPPTVEYIVRCSFVEIYLEKVLDLLNPTNRIIQIMSSSNNEGVTLDGLSEACCFDESDVVSLLMRGNACRTVSSTKMNTDSSRSHAIFILKIEQKDNSSGISKVSQVRMIDMAGSELSGKVVEDSAGAAIHHESMMINKSISWLHSVIEKVAENQSLKDTNILGDFNETLHKQSKLTHILRDVFGGNCRTSVILTASPASYNISESIRTMKFGRLSQNIKNCVKPCVDMSPFNYRKQLIDAQQNQSVLADLVNKLSAECFQLKQDAQNKKIVESQYDGPLWKIIESVLMNGASPDVIRSISRQESNVSVLQEEVVKTRGEVDNLSQLCEKLENFVSERQSEVAVLRTQNDVYTSEKKKDQQELIVVKNEMRLLTQKKQEVEHNLRTSQFREYEATVFLRQFRRFYRRLLRNKAHQGTGRTAEVIERVPGVPDLNDLIDVDSLLLEAGLIEESELHDDTATGAYRPSTQALGRSTDATNKAWKEAALHGKVDELESFDRYSLAGQRLVGAYHVDSNDGADAGAGVSLRGQSISNRQQFLGTPAGRLTTMRERELERDLLRATERCIELQVALNEEKANVDVLANRSSNVNKKKIAQESIHLKQQLDKKTHDLQAIIWKMNELHLINKTYNEKMSNREQHVAYLEENLVELQSSNRGLILERQEAEGRLREELDNLKVLVDAMTVPLWQFGECGVTGHSLENRIRLPACCGMLYGKEQENSDGFESLESIEEPPMHDEEGESDCENVLELPEANSIVVAHADMQMHNVSTQTKIASGEKGTMTDRPFTLPPPLSASTVSVSTELMPSRNTSANSTQPVEHKTANQSCSVFRAVFTSFLGENITGGMPADNNPRRSVNKFGLMIRPGVLKESSSKLAKKSNTSFDSSFR